MKATTLPHARRDPLPALPARLFDLRGLSVVTALATYALIVLGGTVRATDSGTACPDWPLCHGQVIPPLDSHVLVEFAHRMVASVVGFMILAVVIGVWRAHRRNALLVRAAALLLVLLAAQVILGGVTVKTETAASIVALHLSIALTLFSVLILIASGVVLAGRPQGTGVASRDGLASHPGLAAATIAATLALIVLGAYVSQTGAGLAYPDWPLFDGKLVSAGGRLADLHYAHRLVAAVAGVLLGALAWQTFREERAGPVRLAVPVACALYVAQVFVGAGNIWLDLATSVRIVHLALASALWGVIVFAVIWSFLAPRAGGARR